MQFLKIAVTLFGTVHPPGDPFHSWNLCALGGLCGSNGPDFLAAARASCPPSLSNEMSFADWKSALPLSKRGLPDKEGICGKTSVTSSPPCFYRTDRRGGREAGWAFITLHPEVTQVNIQPSARRLILSQSKMNKGA